MFTNGMCETNSSMICLKDTSVEAFTAALQFMYSGELGLEDSSDTGSLLLQILLLADQFGIAPLLHECCKIILECISEVDRYIFSSYFVALYSFPKYFIVWVIFKERRFGTGF